MDENRQVTLPVGRGIVRELELTGHKIRGVQVLNNTPAYLFLALHANPARQDCVLQVEPFSYLSTPMEAEDRLYIVDGELVAPLANNEKAVVIWGETPRALNVSRVKRTVEYLLSRNAAVTTDGTGAGNTSTIHALGLGGGIDVGDGAQYVLPGFASHRTLYAALDGGTFVRAVLEGQYGGRWHVLRDVTPGAASDTLTADLTDLALPEFVRLTVTPSQNTVLNAVIRFDI